MGVVTMTIGGTDVLPYLQLETLEIDHSINNRPVLRCRLRVREPGTYRPNTGDDVIVVHDATRVFGGVVFSFTETDVVDYKHRDVQLECTGYEMFADNTLLNGILFSSDLKTMMTAIVNNVGHGVTVDGAQATGPTVPDQGFPFMTCRGCLDQLAVVSGWNYKFDFFKHVRMYQPGTVGAPFALTDTNSSILELTSSRTLQNYINNIWVQFGSTTQRQVTETLHGDGSTHLFPLNYNVSTPPSVVTVNGVVYPVGIYGVNTGLKWYYREVDPTYPHSLIHDLAEPTLGIGDSIVATYTAQFPGAVYVEDSGQVAANGPYSIVLQYQDVYDRNQALALGQGELLRRTGLVRSVKAVTATPGLEPGMTVSVTATKRGITATNCLITSVQMQHKTARPDGTNVFFYEIEALEGNQYQANWIQFFRDLQNMGGVSGAVTATAVTTSAPSVLPYAFWGGSRQVGQFANNVWVDAIDYMPIALNGSSGQPVTVRVFQRTGNAGTTVQVRIVKRVGASDTQMASGAASTSTTWNEQLLTFTPSAGANDYVLQAKGSNGNAQVWAIGMSL
jgi:hypothetical protein